MNQFNEELKARLIAAGYSKSEMEYGALTAQAKVSLLMLKREVAENPGLLVTWMMLSATMARILATASNGMNLDAERITAASDIIGEAAMERAKALAEQSDSRVLDATPAPRPQDVN